MIGELLQGGLLHDDVSTVNGDGMEHYTSEPKLIDGELTWEAGAKASLNEKIVRPVSNPFQPRGGLKTLTGSLGTAVMKISAVKEERHIVEAPVAVFEDQYEVKKAFQAGDLDRDVIVVVRYQGPKANGMPELHSLTPPLAVLQDRGFKVALVTDGRMSGASGKVPAAIHVSPEAMDDGAIARLKDGDVVRVDATNGVLDILTEGVMERVIAPKDLSASQFGTGREMFEVFRQNVGPASTGASAI